MRPSTTTLGRAWLAEFDEIDRPAAVLLIDSLEIHDHVEIMSTLAEQLRTSMANEPGATPAVLIPIRSTEDLTPLVEGPIAEHIAYKTFDPGASYSALPGSEADVGAMFRGLVESGAGTFLAPDTSLYEQKRLRVRSIFLVVDYCGSGTQASRFAAAFRANTTIASWASYGFVRLKIVTYAANIEAARLFRSDSHVDFQAHTVAKSAASADWSTGDREDVKNLCLKYATEDPLYPALGYRDSFGLYLTNMRVPNNLPQILIRSDGPFPGLFPGRQVPGSFLGELPSYRPRPSLARTLRNLGQSTLADRLEEETRPVQALRALAALQLLDFGLAEDEVWAMLALGATETVELRTSLIALGCLTDENKVTKRGRAELQRATYLGSPQTRYSHASRPAVRYEPTQLR